jgi:group II intron reverse transcriptase/maturase
MRETPSSVSVSTKLQRIAELARRAPGIAFTTLAHHIDVEFLKEAYRATRKNAAVGIDGQTAEEYAMDLEENLRSLLDCFKSGRYQAPAVRRVRIPKADGRGTRPIGIPTFEDKVLQRAVSMLLQAVYEQDFLPCSYGFRPGRSAHQALQMLWEETTKMRGGWVLEVDIQSFFESLEHRHLRSFLDQRVRDGVLRRAIDKWLKAGVLEDGLLHRPKGGTPQGGVISPLLANIYLHVVLDEWFEAEVKPRLRGRSFLIRYADDFLFVFAREDDARRVMDVLPKRLGRFGLDLHPDKTRLVRFRRPSGRRETNRTGRVGGSIWDRPGTFDLLGFTHYWGWSWQGRWVLKRRTAKDRLRRGLQDVNLWLRRHRHLPIVDQHRALSRKLQGHYAYFGITGNAHCLGAFRHLVKRRWQKWLNRRSDRGGMEWNRFERLLQRYPLPSAVVVHSVYRRAAKP